MNAEQTGGIVTGSVGGDLSFQAGGDIVAGNKTIINNIIQRIAKELTTTPYKFLASYEIADRDIFYGRDAVIEELAAQVGRHRVLLINGASGAGKCSLVNAGLIPRVADNGYTFVAFREYGDPLTQLQAYFDTAHRLSPPQPPSDVADGQGSLLQLIRGFGAFPLVIFLDQFERFFVRVDDDRRRAFIAAFSHCLQHSEAKDLCFVLAFRREFLGQLTTEFEEQIPEFLNEAYRINLLPLSKTEAREAVLRPLENTSLRIQYDEDFVNNVLLAGLAEQTGGRASIDPPHLQIVCNQLFEAARQRLQARTAVQINRALYDELGGAQNILNTYLDKVVEDVAQDPARVAIVHSILKTMIDTGTNTRSFVALEGFKRALPDVNEAEILRFIEKLLDKRVVEERKPAYSLSHEHMVGKVKEWFDPRELERKRAEETLNRGMMEWNNSGALLNRGQVERIRKWLPDPTAEEHDLLQASEKNYHEEERKEVSRQKLKKISLYGGAVFTVIVMILGIFSVIKAAALQTSIENRAVDSIHYVWTDLGTKQEETDRLTNLEQKLTTDRKEPVHLVSSVVLSDDRKSQRTQPDGFDCHTWLESGFRALYCQVRSIISIPKFESISGLQIFLPGGPHEKELNFKDTANFGHYNPEFLNWIDKHLIPEGRDDVRFNQLTNLVYKTQIGPVARALYHSHEILFATPDVYQQFLKAYKDIGVAYKKYMTNGHALLGASPRDANGLYSSGEVTAAYSAAAATYLPKQTTDCLKKKNVWNEGFFGLSSQLPEPYSFEYVKNQYRKLVDANKEAALSLQEDFRWLSDYLAAAKCDDFYLANTAGGFWVRRSMDGTENQIFGLIKKLLATFEPAVIGKP
jgi:hypothetical protein